MDDARDDLIRESVRFAAWAAGQGITPADDEPASSPEDFLLTYSLVTGDEDWATIHEHIIDDVRSQHPDPRHLSILAGAMAEIKATSDGLSDQPIADIVQGCIDEIAAIAKAEGRT